MAEKIKVGRVSDVPAGAGLTVTAAGRQIAVFNLDGQILAVDGTCPHRGGPLGEGFVSNGKVSCPWHGWTFDVKSGVSSMNPGLKIPCYPVTVEGDDVYLVV